MASRHGARSARHERVASLLHREFALLLQQGRLPISTNTAKSFVSVLCVKVEPRLSLAHIYISNYDRDVVGAVVSELSEQAALCRKLLASRVALRRMPELRFHSEDELEPAWHVVPQHDDAAIEPR